MSFSFRPFNILLLLLFDFYSFILHLLWSYILFTLCISFFSVAFSSFPLFSILPSVFYYLFHPFLLFFTFFSLKRVTAYNSANNCYRKHRPSRSCSMEQYSGVTCSNEKQLMTSTNVRSGSRLMGLDAGPCAIKLHPQNAKLVSPTV
jgi:hypothetical protein